MTLSTRTKESIKTGLAMSIAYGIALSMDWEKPYRAGFAMACPTTTWQAPTPFSPRSFCDS